jgi:tRNA wybutosine-synthesizing protein 2
MTVLAYLFLGADLWRLVAKSLGVKRVARRTVISADGYRSPQVDLLLGDSGIVQHVDNGIK